MKQNTIRWIEIEELPGLGWIKITEIGEENVYFTIADGTLCFCKAG